jgi:hypothetical protein
MRYPKIIVMLCLAACVTGAAAAKPPRLFLGGLLSSRARLRFTDRLQNAIKWSCRSIDFQRTANSVLTVCVSQGVQRCRNRGLPSRDV